MKQKLCIVLMLALLLPAVALSSYAAESIGFTISMTPDVTKVGEQVTLTVSLKGYTESAEQIRGLQVDIDGVDPQVLEVVEYNSLIGDDTADSNTASYNTDAQRLRLVYVQLDDGVLTPCEDVFRVVLQVNSELTTGSSIQLPITVKIQTVSQQLTLTSQCTVKYAQEISTVNSVDISWGALTYAYTDGTWNPQTYSYDGAGWTDGGSGYITVKNNAATVTTAEFSYNPERDEISGSFTDGTAPVEGPVQLDAGQEQTVFLVLSGKPSETLNNTTIGTVTVQIGGE